MGVHLSAWLNKDKASNANQMRLLEEIAVSYSKSANKNMIKSLIVGSEVIYRGDMTPQELRTVVADFKKKATEELGLSYPVTTALIYNDPGILEIAEVVDYVLFHVHPFWEQKTKIDQGASRVLTVWENLQKDLEKKNRAKKALVIGETGWPTRGEHDIAIGSEINQRLFLKELLGRIQTYNQSHTQRIKLWYFTAFDEAWKIAEEQLQGGYWGLYDSKRQPKAAIKDLLGIKEKPIVDAGGDQTIQVGEKVELNANLRSSSAAIVSYSWTQVSGQTVATQGAKSKTLSFTAPAVNKETELVFEVAVVDADGLKASSQTRVTVSLEADKISADFGVRKLNGKLLLFVKKANWVDLHYKINSGAQQNIRMTAESGEWIYEVPGLKAGDRLEYFFTISSTNVQDTPWQIYIH
jgi:exo-beta-1,3-glucanase (GH17 family)